MQNSQTKISDFSNTNKLFQMNDRVNETYKVIKELDRLNNKEYAVVIKEAIQTNTKFRFDEKDEQWNEFIIKYSCVLSEIREYSYTIFDVLCGTSLLSMIAAYVYSLLNNIPYTASMNVVCINAFYCIYCCIVIRYITPYIITYYLLRKERNLSRIFFKSIKYAQWGNILMLIIVFTIMISA